MLRAEADKQAGTGRLLLLCMPFRSGAHAAIGLSVFALDSPKFFGALDEVPQVGHMCEKRVAGSVGRRRPSCTRNCLPHTRRWLTCPETIDVVTDFWQKGHEYTYSFCGGGFCSMSFGIATSCVPSFSLVMVWPVRFFLYSAIACHVSRSTWV